MLLRSATGIALFVLAVEAPTAKPSSRFRRLPSSIASSPRLALTASAQSWSPRWRSPLPTGPNSSVPLSSATQRATSGSYASRRPPLTQMPPGSLLSSPSTSPRDRHGAVPYLTLPAARKGGSGVGILTGPPSITRTAP